LVCGRAAVAATASATEGWSSAALRWRGTDWHLFRDEDRHFLENAAVETGIGAAPKPRAAHGIGIADIEAAHKGDPGAMILMSIWQFVA
jgi:hypothetical protein